MNDFLEFLWLHGFDFFAAGFKLFEGLDRGLGHSSVGFVGPADDDEFFGGSEAFVSILIVEADTKQMDGLSFAATGYFLHLVALPCS